MKKILFSLFIIIWSLNNYGNSLVFNQVLILNNGTTYTVPTGKVWKVVSAVYTNFNIGYSQTCRAIIGGTTVELIPFSFYDGNSYGRSPITTAFPMWLPETTTIKPIELKSKMFVIEFNIIP